MLSATNSLGLSELQAYESIDGPIGPQRDDRRALAVALASHGGEWEAIAGLLDFGTGAAEAAGEPEESVARQKALRRKFEGIMGGPADGNGR